MNLNYKTITKLVKKYPDAFYFLDTKRFEANYDNLLFAFRKHYANSHIAYSYKTNYIPDLCRIVDHKGGFAEIVSEMEFHLARQIGVDYKNIYYNGPYKSLTSIEQLLLNGGYLNLDSMYEIEIVKKIVAKNPNAKMNIGIRCNVEINDQVISRFGFDVNSPSFKTMIEEFKAMPNINLVGVHIHIATRSLETWKPRVLGIVHVIEKYFDPKTLEYVSLGGGLYGNMAESLKKQFSDYIPSYDDYAEIAAKEFAIFAKKHNVENSLKLLIEPGSALAGDAMKFISRVVNIKEIRGHAIATVAGSIYNINPTLNKKNPPIEVVHGNIKELEDYTNLDFGGFTCIESDYLYRGYSGKLAVNDYVIFSNVGSYSVVLKPPFILPNFAIIKFDGNHFVEVKRAETFNDLFFTYQDKKNE